MPNFPDDDVIYFWSGSEEFSELSNFAPARITIELYGKKRKFKSAEAAYHAHKVVKGQVARFESLNALDSRHLSRLPEIIIRDDWPELKDQAMERVLRAKFALPKFRRILSKTGDRELVHYAPWDDYWGGHPTYGGENKLGKLLMEIREDLREREAAIAKRREERLAREQRKKEKLREK